VGTWLRWVSRPAVFSIQYVLDPKQSGPASAATQGPAQAGQSRLTALRGGRQGGR
jgi:hypothetical protein